MNVSARVTARILGTLTLALVAASPSQAALMIVNGGFEAGFASWIRVDQLGSEGSFFIQSGTTSPVNGDPVPAPPEGVNAAMTDAQGPGTHVLYQDFVATAGNAVLSFDLFIGNRDSDFFVAPSVGLDFSTPQLNQQARVDILRGGTDPFSVSAADVLQNLYQTMPGDPLLSGYTTHTFDLSALLAAHAGETLRLRFAETDNVFTFQLGVDKVGVQAAVPESDTTLLFGAALAALLLGNSSIRRARAQGRAGTG